MGVDLGDRCSDTLPIFFFPVKNQNSQLFLSLAAHCDVNALCDGQARRRAKYRLNDCSDKIGSQLNANVFIVIAYPYTFSQSDTMSTTFRYSV